MENNKIANPSPLGLLAFGMTTVLLNLHNSGLMAMSVVLVGMGYAVGGASQVIAGVMDFKRNNLFGATAFSAYGFFWLSLSIIWTNPFGSAAADKTSMGFYLLLWGIFTLFMSIATLKHNRALQVVFFSLTLLFILLAVGDFTGQETITQVAGYVGIFCGLSALYASFGQIINNEYGRKIMPLGEKH